MHCITDPPQRSFLARFKPGFGQRFLVTVEVTGSGSNGEQDAVCIAAFQSLCEEEGVAPVYLLGDDAVAGLEPAATLRAAVARGTAGAGVLLDTSEGPAAGPLLAGEDTPELRLERLVDHVEAHVEAVPLMARADPAGAAGLRPEVLSNAGLAIDSSIRPLFNFAGARGPDFRRHPLAPYWLDHERTLLELPQTAVFWGLLRRQGGFLNGHPGPPQGIGGVMASFGLIERVSLSPGAADVEQAIRGVDIALDEGLPLLVFTCRLPASPAGEEVFGSFCDWWSRIFAYLQLRRVRNATVAGIMEAVER